VIARLPENIPSAAGENRMVTGLDCPGFKLNVPLPLKTENGDDTLPTLPVRNPVELGRFVIVTVWSEVCPPPMLPKSRVGVEIEILIAALLAPVPFNATFAGLPRLVALWVIARV